MLKLKSLPLWGVAGWLLLLAVAACQTTPPKPKKINNQKPVITENGKIVTLPQDTALINYFAAAPVTREKLITDFQAPARIVASVVPSGGTNNRNLILFDNPDLTATFTAFQQHLVNIAQYKLSYERTQDLFANGAASGKDLIEAKTILANEETAITEDEARLRLAGLAPEDLLKASAGTVWVLCDVPENLVNDLDIGNICTIQFTSYPDEAYSGKIEDIGDVVDNITRMVKLRITVVNSKGRLKAGMFALVQFSLSEGDHLCVDRNAIITLQGKSYAFVKQSERVFERREVVIGQQIGDKVLIFNGLNLNDQVVNKGVIQLKGLSFGY
jgi:hypothetical protein